jgi:predicted nucleic acid-binding protein
MKRPKIYYWDSSVFIAFLNDEVQDNRGENVEQFLDEAEAGDVFIITSSFTLVEVIKLKGQNPIQFTASKKLTEFFEKDYFRFVDATRKITASARDLIWTHSGLFPKDAVHLASAIEFASKEDLDAIHSYDADFLKLNGKLGISCPICHPVPRQPLLIKVPSKKIAKKSKRTSN